MTALYIHLPFCRVHCTYCAFAISTNATLQDAYVDALIREIERVEPALAETVYFGGGTPSRTDDEHLRRIFGALREKFTIAEHAEITLEANPEDIEEASLDLWRGLGVNRLSIGVQSFHDDELRAIGRAHDRQQAIDAVTRAVASGVRTSLDLILGLPNQTAESFRQSLDRATSLGIGHLSLYMLDLEERSPLEVQVTRGRVRLPDDELVSDLYLEAVERLRDAGLHQYEISNFARPGEESRHNIRYWTRGDYHGFGLGAHSFQDGRRFANTRDMHEYIERAPHAQTFAEELGEDEVRREKIFLALRRTEGLYYEELLRMTGNEGKSWSERGLSEGWLVQRGARVAFTPAGFLQSNELIARLF
jgi:oxygen-independent coproporphyrinogen-3 oxidase